MARAIGRLTSAVGTGLVAGAAGTAALTALQTVETRLFGREPSTAPAEAVERVLDVEPTDQHAERRLANVAHWGYGTAWGVPRGLLALMPLPGGLATFIHFAAVWGTALVMLPRMDVAPPPTEWGAREVAVDALRHVVYAAGAGAAIALLSRRAR